MSAQPVAESDPDDPVEIMRVLPERFHEQFRAEYIAAAAEAARHVEGYRALHDLLRLWRLTAAAYTAPGFEAGSPACARWSGLGAWRVGADRGDRAVLARPPAPAVTYQVRFEG